MIILDTTLKSLEIILPGAITTNQLPWTTAYVTNGAASPLVESDGLTNGGTAVTLVPAPGASQQQIVKHLSVNNADTVSQKVTIRINNNGTFRNMFIVTLAVGDNLVYTAEGEFQIFDLNGNVKQSLLTLPLGVASGGTGVITLAAHGVVVGEGTSAVAVIGPSATVGLPLVSAGASADPTFTALKPSGGGVAIVTTTLADGATPALDASLGTVFRLAAAGDRTIGVPTNPTPGQKIVIQHFASGGARTLALNSGAGGFRFGSDIVALTQTASGKTDYIGAIYNDTDSKWDVVAVTKGF